MEIEELVNESLVPIHEIEENLYLGNKTAAEDLNLLQEVGIQCIVQCLESKKLSKIYPKFDYYFVPLTDLTSANLSKHTPGAIKFIHENRKHGKKVLVHCAAGISRSASIIISYIMAEYQISFERALLVVKNKRNCVNPNFGFRFQLKNFDPHNLAKFLN